MYAKCRKGNVSDVSVVHKNQYLNSLEDHLCRSKKKGPITDRWEMPQLRGLLLDRQLPTMHLIFAYC